MIDYVTDTIHVSPAASYVTIFESGIRRKNDIITVTCLQFDRSFDLKTSQAQRKGHMINGYLILKLVLSIIR